MDFDSFALIFDLEIFLNYKRLSTSVNMRVFWTEPVLRHLHSPSGAEQKKPNKTLD